MRLDKFLKISRIIKRRVTAKNVSDQGRVLLNGREAKASSKVKKGDELVIFFGHNKLQILVELLTESTRKQDASEMYRVLKEQNTNE